ncbi:SDR family NAD(P)-dependent oxidoreductase [Streptomyces iconiensis]|uniref:SDR family oxidoreductase n=1 Tax=Streptomyces iconiensis TaxID=1384038 RepID=A0ABT7A2Y6_9ACTN|nr:SDR family oxidoreductase [Streptomyces iconiensis]MDJ1135432.1 SDR family oxidoreductase [Streptomyces iconiensis]
MSVAVVSGAATGIGRAVTARLVARRAGEVIVVGRRPDRLADLAGQLGPRVVVVAADLSKPDGTRRVLAAVAGRTVDVLVNNAGGNADPHRVQELDEVADAWYANLRANVLPVVLLTHALLPLLARPGGRIVTVGSVAAVRGPATYGGAKAALHPWSAELAAQMAGDQITVNVVAPGYVTDTEFYGDRMSSDLHADRSRRSPMDRGATPEEVAATICHLAGPDAGFITGQVVHINGGALLPRP